ncbi:DUF4160 domain-containing protein [Bdellovibrionota bacterium FG-2]
MLTISQFYGIVIQMFYDDHNPPHFHAVYGEFEILVAISPIRILEGNIPGRVKSMVLEWAALHQTELLQDWSLCEKKQKPSDIPPLE